MRPLGVQVQMGGKRYALEAAERHTRISTPSLTDAALGRMLLQRALEVLHRAPNQRLAYEQLVHTADPGAATRQRLSPTALGQRLEHGLRTGRLVWRELPSPAATKVSSSPDKEDEPGPLNALAEPLPAAEHQEQSLAPTAVRLVTTFGVELTPDASLASSTAAPTVYPLGPPLYWHRLEGSDATCTFFRFRQAVLDGTLDTYR